MGDSVHGREFSAFHGASLDLLDHAREGIPEYVNTVVALDLVDFSRTGLILYLYGPPGTGKTYAALAGINYLTRRNDKDFNAGEADQTETIGPKRVAYTGLMRHYRSGDTDERTADSGSFHWGITGSSIFPERYTSDAERTTNIALIDDYLPNQRSFDGEDVLHSFAREVYDKGGLLIVTSNAEDPSVVMREDIEASEAGSEALRKKLFGYDSNELTEAAKRRRIELAVIAHASMMAKIGQMIKPIYIGGKDRRDHLSNWQSLGLE